MPIRMHSKTRNVYSVVTVQARKEIKGRKTTLTIMASPRFQPECIDHGTDIKQQNLFESPLHLVLRHGLVQLRFVTSLLLIATPAALSTKTPSPKSNVKEKDRKRHEELDGDHGPSVGGKEYSKVEGTGGNQEATRHLEW